MTNNTITVMKKSRQIFRRQKTGDHHTAASRNYDLCGVQLFGQCHDEDHASGRYLCGEGLCGGHAGFRKRRDAGTAGGLAAGGQRAADGDTAGDPGETGGWSGGISGGF